MKSQLIGFKNTTFQESNDLVKDAILEYHNSWKKLENLIANSCFCCVKKLLSKNKNLESGDALEIYTEAITYLLGQKYNPILGKNNFVGSLDNKMQKLFIDKMRKNNLQSFREGSEIGEEHVNVRYKGLHLSESEQYIQRKKIEDFEESLNNEDQINLDLGL